MSLIAAVFFDLDGVLVDSLRDHLSYSRHIARELGVPVTVPGVQEFRRLVQSGVVVSPMKHFFTAVGFPEDVAEDADALYQIEFADLFKPRLFEGVAQMLAQLSASGLPLGIVTANTLANTRAALGESIRHFAPESLFTNDDGRKLAKDAALAAGAKHFRVSVSDVLYVGDQPRDFMAASAAQAQFLGVTYGWGISGSDGSYPVVSSVPEMAEFILARTRAQPGDIR